MVTSTLDARPTAAAPPWMEIDWRPHVHDAQIDGRAVRYLDYGRGPTLFLLHGLGCCWQWWLEVLPALGEHRRVIAVDIPGFGHSESLPAPGSMESQATCMSELADQLGLSDITVAGHSMGGLITLALARTRSDLVTRVILVNAGGVPMTEARLGIVIALIKASRAFLSNAQIKRALVRRPRARGFISKVAVGNAGAMSGRFAAEVIPLMAAPGYVDAVVAAGEAVRDTEPEAVRQPTLLLWGEADRIVTVHNAREMQARLPNPTLVLIPGTGHSPHVGAPDAFVTHVLEFTAP